MFNAIVGSGGIWFGSNPANQQYEVDHLVELGNPKFIITGTSSLPVILKVCDQRNIPKENVFVLDLDTFQLYTALPSVWWGCAEAAKLNQVIRSFTDLLCHGEEDWCTINAVADAKETAAALYPTSGTTGLPKLAMISHFNLVAHQIMLHEQKPYQVQRLMALPLFHLFATSFAFVQPTRYGDRTYIMRRFQLENYLQNHDRYQITDTCMTPPMLMRTISSSLNVRHLMRSVRWAGVGGAPCEAASINKMRSLLTGGTMSSVWGMTEIGVATMMRLGDHDETGSIGRLVRGYEGKLVDANGDLVLIPQEPGELYIRSPGIMLGYRNMKFAEDEKDWFRTGDICTLREGKLYVVGRAKELIKVRGWQVAPAELEAVLLQHPLIADVAVCGSIAQNGVDEVPRAYVVREKRLREADMVTADEVYQYSRERLASYKALDGGICFVEEIPRTGSGKIQRMKLTRMDHLRRSVTAVLLSAQATPEMKERVAEVKQAALQDTTPQDIRSPPRRSARLIRRSTASSDKISKVKGLYSVVRARRRGTNSTSSSGSTSPSRPVNSDRKGGRTSRRQRLKDFLGNLQAAAA